MHNMIGIRLSNKLYEKDWPNVSKNYDDLIVDERYQGFVIRIECF